MNKLGLVKTNYRDTYYFQPNTMLQFGGSGDDRIYDTKVLTTGDYAVVGYSTSSALDGNARPATAASWFIAIIDKAFPTSGFIKAIAWEDAASNYVIGGRYFKPMLTVDASDNIYYLYGSVSIYTNYVVKKLSGTDLSLLATSSALNAALGSVRLIIYGTQIHVYHTKTTGLRYFVNRFNMSNLSSAGAEFDTGIPSGGAYYTEAVEYGSYVVFGSPHITSYYAKVTGLFDPSTFSLADYEAPNMTSFGVYNHPDLPGVTTDGTHLYFLGRSATAANLKLLKVLRKVPAPFYTAVANLEIAAPNIYGFLDPIYYDGSIYVVGSNNVAGVVGTSDPYLYKVNPATMLATDADYVKYSSGTQIGVGGTSWTLARAPIVYEANKLLLSGYTTGNLSGFVNQGGNDCVMMKTNLAGEIL